MLPSHLTKPLNERMREDRRSEPPVRQMIIELLKTHEATKRRLHEILDLIQK